MGAQIVKFQESYVITLLYSRKCMCVNASNFPPMSWLKLQQHYSVVTAQQQQESKYYF